jgi:hypothetical protein
LLSQLKRSHHELRLPGENVSLLRVKLSVPAKETFEMFLIGFWNGQKVEEGAEPSRRLSGCELLRDPRHLRSS